MSPKIFFSLFCFAIVVQFGWCQFKIDNKSSISSPSIASDVPQLFQFFGPTAEKTLKAVEKKNEEEKRKFQEIVEHFSYTAFAVGTDPRKFANWLIAGRPDRLQTFMKIFIYLVQLDNVPICIAVEFLESVDKQGLIQNEISKIEKRAGKADKRSAYIFGQDGVEMVQIDGGEGVRCRASLEEPAAVGKLLYEIIVALEEEEKRGESAREARRETEKWIKETNRRNGTLGEAFRSEKEEKKKLEQFALTIKINVVFGHLTQSYNNDKHEVVKIVHAKMAKWDTIGKKISRIEHQFKEYALWLFAPTNFQYLISAILSFAKLSGTITLAVDSARSFGLDELLIQETQFLGQKMIDGGANCELVMWIFGPNGVVPLYLRGSEVAEEREYFDHTGRKYRAKEVAKWRMGHGEAEEREFLKKIIDEMVQRKGHPLEELMAHTVANLKNMGNKQKWQARIERFGEGLRRFKEEMKAIDVKHVLKQVTAFFITPRHIVFLFKLIMTIFGLYEPIFITLEVLQFLGITDILLEIMVVSAETLKETQHFREHKNAGKALDFMINENGLAPLFLTMGSEEERKTRRMRVAKELELFHLLKNVIIEHNGNALKELYKYFVEQIKGNALGLMIVQTFHREQGHERVARNWGKMRKTMPMFQAKYDLEIVKAHAFKHIYEYREMKERVAKFDKAIQQKIAKCVPSMEEVCLLKEERGDDPGEKVVDNAGIMGGGGEEKTKQQHPKGIIKST